MTNVDHKFTTPTGRKCTPRKKLDPVFKAKWTHRLRTTPVPQARYQLGDERHGMCCLGVGCDAEGIDFDADRDIPTPTVLKRWGLSQHVALVLARANDTYTNKRATFDEIADWIDEHL